MFLFLFSPQGQLTAKWQEGNIHNIMERKERAKKVKKNMGRLLNECFIVRRLIASGV